MNTALMIILLAAKCIWSRRLEYIELRNCHLQCGSNFNCNCERSDPNPTWPYCVSIKDLCDGVKDCKDGSDELECSCSSDEFQCSHRIESSNLFENLHQCIPSTSQNDGYLNCYNGKDEDQSQKHCFSSRCDSYIHCPWLTPNDEANCYECPDSLPNRCDCNQKGEMTCTKRGFVCYNSDEICNQIITCSDSSDEANCSCEKDQYKCQCYSNNPITCPTYEPGKFIGCIPLSQYHDGVAHCPDASDETQFNRIVTCDNCQRTIRRLSNISLCRNSSWPLCDESTCYDATSLHCTSNNCNDTDVICMSNCSATTSKQCDRGFQCADGSLGLAYQFCDGRIDCPDNSDEIRNQPGFKCVGIESAGTCVLPQRNLYDNVAQCSDESDLCLNNSCFQCFDKKLLISSKQVCDGVFDCYDWSDECLCLIHFNKSLCNERFSSGKQCTNKGDSSLLNGFLSNANKTVHSAIKKGTILCQTKWDNQFEAVLCDGRPECRDFSDECNCENPPDFCNDTCHDGYFIGDRYCDGIEDEFYKIINKSYCPKGFDEENCPKRFKCQSNSKVSIDVDQLCDGTPDCDDKSDELNCQSSRKETFSSDTELIAYLELKICFWIMSIAVICGNSFVIYTTAKRLKKRNLGKISWYQKFIVLNISIADFIMGIYLLLISIYSVYYSGYYGKVDYEWRSSLRCSIIGSLAVLSSEASCLLMLVLTIYRSYTLCKPFSSVPCLACKITTVVALVWLVSFLFAFVPIILKNSQYFSTFQFSNSTLSFQHFWNRHNKLQYSCRLSQLSSKPATSYYNRNFTKEILQPYFLKNVSTVEFGYYGQTSVCMPRFYISQGENAWEYSFAIITVNFLSFIFIAISYVLIYFKTTKRQAEVRGNQRVKEDARMQRRISRIIITDFLCWIPICIIAFVKLSGVYVNDLAYIVSAGLLLPINSVFNPFLYSSLSFKGKKLTKPLRLIKNYNFNKR